MLSGKEKEETGRGKGEEGKRGGERETAYF